MAIDYSIKGTGFLIWQLKNVLPYDRFVAALRRADAKWVSIKLADGPNNFNQVNEDGSKIIGNDSFLKVLIQRLQDDGFSVGMWQFIYTRNRYSPGLQAAKAAERIAKFGLRHLLVDAEGVGQVGALWNDPLYKRDAVTYMNQLDISKAFPVGICSYRFPDYFPGSSSSITSAQNG